MDIEKNYRMALQAKRHLHSLLAEVERAARQYVEFGAENNSSVDNEVFGEELITIAERRWEQLPPLEE